MLGSKNKFWGAVNTNDAFSSALFLVSKPASTLSGPRLQAPPSSVRPSFAGAALLRGVTRFHLHPIKLLGCATLINPSTS